MNGSKEFFQELREGEQYANVSVTMEVYQEIRNVYLEEEDYKLNHVKAKNSELNENPLLCEMYKERSKLNREISKEEYKLNNK